jgi:hypothetical protein
VIGKKFSGTGPQRAPPEASSGMLTPHTWHTSRSSFWSPYPWIRILIAPVYTRKLMWGKSIRLLGEAGNSGARTNFQLKPRIRPATSPAKASRWVKILKLLGPLSCVPALLAIPRGFPVLVEAATASHTPDSIAAHAGTTTTPHEFVIPRGSSGTWGCSWSC